MPSSKILDCKPSSDCHRKVMVTMQKTYVTMFFTQNKEHLENSVLWKKKQANITIKSQMLHIWLY